MATFNARAVVAEFIAMLLFVYICCGSATRVAGDDGWVQQVALTFGLCIMVLAYMIGHRSGGHINCAVTLALVVAGECSYTQGMANFAAQMMGSIIGAFLLRQTVTFGDGDKTAGLAVNLVAEGVESWQALVAEVLGTFLLVLTVFETAVNPKSEGNRRMAAVAIGGAVYLAHSILIPIDGCSINPTRSAGPAMVVMGLAADVEERRKIVKDQWIFWVGPLFGAVLGAGFHMFIMPATKRSGKKV